MTTITDNSEKSPNAYTDHEAKAREIVDDQIIQRHGEAHYVSSLSDLVSAISAALREAEERATAKERERCAAISDLERDSKIEAAQKFEQRSRERMDMYLCSVTANSISVLIRAR